LIAPARADEGNDVLAARAHQAMAIWATLTPLASARVWLHATIGGCDVRSAEHNLAEIEGRPKSRSTPQPYRELSIPPPRNTPKPGPRPLAAKPSAGTEFHA
jgi:hypothetical protein